MDVFGEFKLLGEGCIGLPGVDVRGNGENDCIGAEEFSHGILMLFPGGRGDT